MQMFSPLILFLISWEWAWRIVYWMLNGELCTFWNLLKLWQSDPGFLMVFSAKRWCSSRGIKTFVYPCVSLCVVLHDHASDVKTRFIWYGLVHVRNKILGRYNSFRCLHVINQNCDGNIHYLRNCTPTSKVISIVCCIQIFFGYNDHSNKCTLLFDSRCKAVL